MFLFFICVETYFATETVEKCLTTNMSGTLEYFDKILIYFFNFTRRWRDAMRRRGSGWKTFSPGTRSSRRSTPRPPSPTWRLNVGGTTMLCSRTAAGQSRTTRSPPSSTTVLETSSTRSLWTNILSKRLKTGSHRCVMFLFRVFFHINN